MLSEIHKAHRRLLDLPCWLDEGMDRAPVECRLRKISKSGGKLSCPATDQVPNEFNLYLTRDGNVGRKCLVTSREGNEIEFNFVSGNVEKSRWLPAMLDV